MADLLIPATIRSWLFFLLVFVLLGYPVTFSIVFGAIGGLAGGLATAWWQVKGGAPVPADEESTTQSWRRLHQIKEITSRWDLPLIGPSNAQKRYLERTQRTRSTKIPSGRVNHRISRRTNSRISRSSRSSR
ncbi:MAG: hypothetical protein DCF15_21095 [Phormidesmis priestleyi]|uniref:Uncharacterized protein n=1 Tax=Phormidesmis priestleyi TaxID=268141 RepID=A0A2W4WMZ6_9CYAN|nr:MAG: hypothetical protein DCF15_21095 [Phormidesmis priestleyi]